MGIYQIKFVVTKIGDQGDVNIVILQFIEVEKPLIEQKRLGETVSQIVEQWKQVISSKNMQIWIDNEHSHPIFSHDFSLS